MSQSNTTNAVTGLLKVLPAADWLGVSDRTLWGLTAPRGPIPCVRVGNSVRYRLADLEAFAADQAAASLSAVAK